MPRKSLKNVQACPIHQAVLDACLVRFDGPARSFSFDDVLKDLGYGLIADSIEWDRIREWMESFGYVLTPVAEKFFTMPTRQRSHMSEADKVKFVCIGRGKATAGYAKPTVEGGALAILWGNQKVKMNNGTLKAMIRYNADAADQNSVENPSLSTTKRLRRQKSEGGKHRPHLLAPPPKKDDDAA